MSAETRPGVAILASGGGTTAEAFIRATQDGTVEADVNLVVCSKPAAKAKIWERVANLNDEFSLDIPVVHINHETHPWKDSEERERGLTNAESEAIYQEVALSGSKLVALMGYMRIVRGALLEEYGWHESYTSPYQAAMLNTHPGPLPETADTHGPGASQRVLDLGLQYSAHTVHVVAGGVDTGPAVWVTPVPVLAGDDANSLFERVQVFEKKELPIAIDAFLKEQEDFDVRARD